MRAAGFAGCVLICGAGMAMGQYAGQPVTSATPVAGATASALTASQGELKIQPGDLISIATYGAPELSTTTSSGPIRVGDRGEIMLPYLGTVKLAGMTAPEASMYLEKELKDAGILVNPQVSVQIAQSPAQVITVLGEVTKPEPVPDPGANLRLLDVISACGGFTPLASHTLTVHRQGDAEPITVNLGVDAKATDASNIPLMPGDTVVVPKVGNAYVVGQVQRPAAIPLANNAPLTVVQAISMTGGLKYGAALSKAMIIRTTGKDQRVEILFDLKKVMQGKEKDIALTSNDILYIPTNGFKAALAANGAQQGIYAAALTLGYVVP